MTLRRTAALTAACALSLTALPALFARADPSRPTAAAAQVPVDSEASEAAVTVPSTSTPVIRHYHRRHRRSSSYSPSRVRSLPSRGVDLRAEAAQTVVGRLAIVSADRAVIVAGRDRAGRVLSTCPKGQYLNVSGETATQYAVLMIDRTLGYVAKSDVQLLDYQVAASGDAGDAPQAAPAGDGTLTLGLRMVRTARGYLGVPYVWGGNTASGIDCSGFVKAVYANYGIALPRVAREQATVGYDVPHDVAAGDWTNWVPGDRMYFACHHPEIDHTAMYIGGGLFIHASAGHGHQVAIDQVDNAYFSQHLICVRRSHELLGEPIAPGDFRRTASTLSASDPEASQR